MTDTRDAALLGAGPAAVSGPRRRPVPEATLVREAQRGSRDALEELFRRHWPRAHRAAWLVIHDAAGAEDVAQEAFLAAVRSPAPFARRRPFGPWLPRMVVTRAIDHAGAREVRGGVAAADEPFSWA